MIKRIIVTGDTDRPINQFGNISFFYNMLKFQLEYLTDIYPHCHASTKKHLDFDEWIKRESGAGEWEGEEYRKDDLVLGFEISNRLENYLRLK